MDGTVAEGQITASHSDLVTLEDPRVSLRCLAKGTRFGLNLGHSFAGAYVAEDPLPTWALIMPYGRAHPSLKNLHQTAAVRTIWTERIHNSRDRADVMLIPPKGSVRKERAISPIGSGDFLLAPE